MKRTFQSTVETVWSAFTDADILRRWWSPEGMECSHASVDLNRDGLFHYCFKAENGSEYWGRGVYQAISAPVYLAYIDTFSDAAGNAVAPSHYGIPGDDILPSLVEFEFTAGEGVTMMEAIMDNHYDEKLTEQFTQGWNSMFDKLASLLSEY